MWIAPIVFARTLLVQDPTFPIKKAVPLTYVIDYEPCWSPDGKKIALISSRHGGLKLHILEMDNIKDGGSNMRQLTFGETEEDSPAWSPDGKKIAFVSIRKGISEICVMNADGSNIQQITHGKKDNIHPAWSPDSKQILFDTTFYEDENRRLRTMDAKNPTIGEPQDNFIDLVTVSVDGSKWRRLTMGGGYTYAFFSPDGKHIVHRRPMGEKSQIWIMNSNGTNDHNISGAEVQDGWPSWAFDSKRICFVRRSKAGNLSIFSMDLDGTHVVQLTDMSGDSTNPRWSPDGKQIVFSRRNSSTLTLIPAPKS